MSVSPVSPERPEPPGPIAQYRARVAAGDIAFDEAQAAAAETLETLHRRLERESEPRRTRALLPGRSKAAPARGLYLFGGVGRGKSMLMDMFFAAAPVARKRRVHFYAFMQEIHAAIGEWRKLDEGERKRRPYHVRGAGDDPIPPVAERVAQGARLLCFDEFQVEDPATAMILSRLFEQFFARTVVIVATSNRAPDDLYKDGLNRQLFLPFLALLKEHLDVLELDSGTDYRLRRLAGEPVYYIGADAGARLDVAWAALTDGSRGRDMALDLCGRKLDILTAKGVARASFDHLCREARGAADYLALARAFPVVMIDGVPRLALEERNEAQRLVTLIDALYERKVKLFASAAAPADEIASGAPAFARAASRLAEMQSADYLALPHIRD
ncbi:MAG: cell division protein ZapE [Alphaproteobacteria bacterium]